MNYRGALYVILEICKKSADSALFIVVYIAFMADAEIYFAPSKWK